MTQDSNDNFEHLLKLAHDAGYNAAIDEVGVKAVDMIQESMGDIANMLELGISGEELSMRLIRYRAEVKNEPTAQAHLAMLRQAAARWN